MALVESGFVAVMISSANLYTISPTLFQKPAAFPLTDGHESSSQAKPHNGCFASAKPQYNGNH